MDNAMILLYDICRLCLDEPGVEKVFGLVEWAPDILAFTDVKITPGDMLPQLICANCRDIIHCTKILRDIATANDKRLRSLRDNPSDPEPCLNGYGLLTSECIQNKPKDITDIAVTSVEKSNEKIDSNEPPGILNTSLETCFRHRIVFEDDKLSDSESHNRKKHKKHKKHKKRRKSSPSRGSECNIAKKAKTGQISITLQKQWVTTSPTNPNIAPDFKKPGEIPCSSKDVILSTPEISAASCRKDVKPIKLETDNKCQTCNKVYSTPKKLYLHQLTHNKKFICPLDVCEKKFATKNDLQKHIRSHTGEKPFKCNLCEQSFSQNVTLKAHKENLHNEMRRSQSQS